MDECATFGIGGHVACRGILETLDDGLFLQKVSAHCIRAMQHTSALSPPAGQPASPRHTYRLAAAIGALYDGERCQEAHNGHAFLVKGAHAPKGHAWRLLGGGCARCGSVFLCPLLPSTRSPLRLSGCWGLLSATHDLATPWLRAGTARSFGARLYAALHLAQVSVVVVVAVTVDREASPALARIARSGHVRARWRPSACVPSLRKECTHQMHSTL